MQRRMLLCACVMLALAGAPAAAADKPKAGAKAPAAKAAKAKPAAKGGRPAAQPAEPKGDIELTHQLGSDKGEQLQRLVERFNAASERKIVIAQRDWDAGELPHMMVLDEEAQAKLLAGKPRYKPVHQVMREAGQTFETLKAPPMMNPLPLDAAGRAVGLPIALSTPVMFYNRDAFRKVGADPDQPPRTWFELQQVLGKLYEGGYGCPYTTSYPAWVHVENLSAWHNEPVAAAGKQEGPLQVNNLVMVRHLALMTSWYKSRYLHLFGRRDEGDAKFALGECQVLTGPSGSFPTLTRYARFDVGVAPLPYHEEVPGAPQNTLASGPVLWVAAGKRPDEYKVVAKFIRFLLTPEVQVEWQRNAGYLPLNRAALLAASSELLQSDLAGVRTAVAQLTNKPATSASRASRYAQRGEIRRILDEELDEVWNERKPPKAALDTAVTRSRALR